MERINKIFKIVLICLIMGFSGQGMAQSCYATGPSMSFPGEGGVTRYSTLQGGCSDGSSLQVQVGSKPSWITAYTTGNYSIAATASPNSTGSSRSGSITILQFGTPIGVVSVSQPAGVFPVGQVSITSGPTQRCKGSGTSDYNASASNATSYSWSISNAWGSTINSSGTVNWDPGFSGTATISVTAHGANSSTSTATRSVTVTAVDRPEPIVPDTEICGYEVVTVTLSNLGDYTRYDLLNGNGGSIANVETQPDGSPHTVTWNITSGGDYSIKGTLRGGSQCSEEWGDFTITQLQDVGSPQVSGANILCKGVLWTDYNVTGGSPNNNYSWSLLNAGGATINNNGRVDWNGFYGNATVRLTATPECGSSVNIDSPVEIKAVDRPEPQVPDTEICGYEVVTVTLSNLGDYTRYDLLNGNGSSIANVETEPDGSPHTVTWNIASGGDYSIRGTLRGSPQCSEEWGEFTITQLQDVGSPQIIGDNTLCMGVESTDYDITNNSPNNNTYSWSLLNAGGATIDNNGTVDWNGFYGNATIRLTATPECGSSVNIDYAVEIESMSTPSFISPETEICGNGDSVSLSLGLLDPNTRYLLMKDGFPTSAEIITDGNGNTDDSRYWEVSSVGTYSVLAEQRVSPYCSIEFNSLQITTKASATVNITHSPADLSNICAGIPITLTSNGNNNQWSTGETSNEITVTPVAGISTTYTLTAFDTECGEEQTTSITITPATPTLWYVDTDGDGFGDADATPVPDCTPRGTGWADNNDDLCPDDPGIAGNFGCPAGFLFENRNWITAKSYDLNETLKSSSKSYYNDLGKLEQTQSLDIETDRTWASTVLYDSHGRTAISTLSAPVDLPGTFQFQSDFIRNDQGLTYSSSDFGDIGNEPSRVGNNYEGTLGWYYSDLNNDTFFTGNLYQDITEYPFSRTIYSTLNPGSVIKSVGENKVDTSGNGTIGPEDEWPQNYTFSMPATDELSLSVAFGDNAYSSMSITKTVTRDVHGNENVVFVDSDGKTLAAARSGGANVSSFMYHAIGEQGYVDVHIPQGIVGITSSDAGAVEVYDMITEAKLQTSLSSLPSGFYRVSVIDLPNYISESISVGYQVNYYDYSLNEYDEADRLVKSYQPIGNTKATKPFTEYEYNGLGQLVHTTSPDEGEAWFKYREDGQIRFSQNSKQKDPNEDGNFSDAEFSYTEYDQFGRPIESGVLISTGFDSADPDGVLLNGTKKEQQFTTYDVADTSSFSTLLGTRASQYGTLSFVTGNVAYTHNDISETWYSYDVYGRVKWLVQNIQGFGAKTMDYEYDPITGLVTKVVYQKGVTGEQFVHRYSYDVKDRLEKVETSTDNVTYELQAEYFYYETGGLRRMELADGAQGVDYVYNLNGQLKGINHPTLGMANDPGGDGNDIFGMQLDYHSNDFARPLSNIGYSNAGTQQFNGNIKGVRWKNAYSNTVESEYVYNYDRNNWLTSADFDPSGSAVGSGALLDHDSSSAEFISGQSQILEAKSSFTLTDGFHAREGSTVTVAINSANGGGIMAGDYDVSNITYDANGNIQSLVRNKGSQDGSNAMDALTYLYDSSKPNQLQQVVDSEGDVANAEDIGSQTDADNYKYNSIGQLTDNLSEGISYIYNASGLVTEVRKDGQALVNFFYNDRNHRVKKESYANGILSSTTFYIRDVSGQIMAIYDNRGGDMDLAEQPVYGNGRIGVAYNSSSTTRDYVYELTDHLGNVRAVFTKTGGQNGYGDGYTDYYPFGMPMPNRGLLGPEGYRYAFQGQEKDPETGKEAFQLRLWDSRIGRWLTTDPAGQYSSPYVGMGNNPILRVDPDGGYDNPVYGSDGKRRGSTVEGNHGEAIIYDGDLEFSKMTVGELMGNGGHLLDNYLNSNPSFENTAAHLNLLNDWIDLPNRVDFDNVVTFPEAIQNRNFGNGMDLFVDIGGIDFKSSTLSIQDFNGIGSVRQVNFFPLVNIHEGNENVLHRPAGSVDLAAVYGTVTLRLLDVHGNVEIVNQADGSFDQFDFRVPLFERLANRRGGNPQTFRFFGFGTGQINTTNPFPFKN